MSRPIISTLTPSRLKSSQQGIIKLSRTHAEIWTSRKGQVRTEIQFVKGEHPTNGLPSYIPFPDNTRGVFYFHSNPCFPPISGSLRFRLTEDVDGFSTGTDLHTSIGRPWEIPLLWIAQNKKWGVIRNLLLEEGLVEQSLFDDIAKLPLKYIWKLRPYSLLFDLDQPVVLDLDQHPSFWLITRRTAGRARHHRMFVERKAIPESPAYSGRVRAQFELSKLSEHEKYPTIVMRTLDRLTPIKPILTSSNVLLPKPGELFMRREFGKAHPWSFELGETPSKSVDAWTIFLKETGRI